MQLSTLLARALAIMALLAPLHFAAAFAQSSIAQSSIAQPSLTQPSSPVGAYRGGSGPDVVWLMELGADGRFGFELAAGALDKWAKGRWVEQDGQIRLFSEPKPVAPELQVRSAKTSNKDEPLVMVTWPNGRGIAGIDVIIGFSDGDVIDGYTQTDGWSLPAEERRQPIWVELKEPIHDIAAARMPLAPGHVVKAVLTPNDLGGVDFDGARLVLSGDHATLHHQSGEIQFVRLPPREQGE